MASKGFHEVLTRGADIVRIVGSFELDDSANPINLSSNAFSVSRLGPGSFKVTFRERFYDIIESQSSVRAQNPIQLATCNGPWDSVENSLIVNLFFLLNVGDPVATDLDPDPQNKVSFGATFARSKSFY